MTTPTQQPASQPLTTIPVMASLDTRYFGLSINLDHRSSLSRSLALLQPPHADPNLETPERRLWRAIFMSIYVDLATEGPESYMAHDVRLYLEELEDVAETMGFRRGVVAGMVAMAGEEWRAKRTGKLRQREGLAAEVSQSGRKRGAK